MTERIIAHYLSKKPRPLVVFLMSLCAWSSDTARVRMNPSLGEFARDNALPLLAALQDKEWT